MYCHSHVKNDNHSELIQAPKSEASLLTLLVNIVCGSELFKRYDVIELKIDLKPCPECGQNEEFFMDDEQETVICVCGKKIIEPDLDKQ